MIKRLLAFLFIGFISLLLLVFYNYSLAQKRLRQARETQFAIKLLEAPTEIAANSRAHFVWKVDAPQSFSTTQTGIYWSYDSTPSALMKNDSPAAVRYANFTPDYAAGSFQLPDQFDLDLTFSKKGTVFFRAYAKVDHDHLWTAEKQIVIK